MKSGFILVNKPEDWTSHDVVQYLRKITGVKKIGHAGTLDPFATGLLIVGIGRQATKQLDDFKNLPKTYIAIIQAGQISDTYDPEGKITKTKDFDLNAITKEKIQDTLKQFTGEQKQTPPMHSAKKIKGRKLYELARKGISIDVKPCIITIHKISLIAINPETAMITIQCTVSSGTYIRSLAHDIGQKLGCGAYCKELKRTAIGQYSTEKAVNVQKITSQNYEKYLFNA